MAATDANLGLFWGGSSATAPFLHFGMSDYFSSVINDARNNSAKVLSLIPKNTKYYGGKFIQERVKFGRNPRQFNSVGDNGNFPDPAQRKRRIYTERGRQAFARFIIQGKLLRAASRDQMADVDPVMEDLDDFLVDYLVDKSRQMHSDGTGRLCEIAENGAASTANQQFTMRVNQDIATGLSSPGATTAGCPDQPPTMYLEPNERVLIVSAAGVPKVIANVVSVDDANQATLAILAARVGTQWSDVGTGNPGVVIGDWVVKTGSTDVSSDAQMLANSAWKNEPQGLGGILGYAGPINGNGPNAEVASDPATSVEGSSANYTAYSWSGTDAPSLTTNYYFQGLPASASATGALAGDLSEILSFNQGVTLNNGGVPRAPLENVFMRALTTLEVANNAVVGVWLSQPALRDTYAETLVGEKRFNDTLDLKGGWDRALVGPGGIPWVTDIRAWHNRVMGLALETGGFTQWVIEDLSWATEQGAAIWQYLQDQDKYQARLVEDYQIMVGVRNRCGINILDLLEA